MRIAIIGSGAIASLFAARLNAVAEVVMVGSWAAQLAAARAGLRLIHPNRGETTHPIWTTAVPAEVAPAPLALVLVKSYQTETAVARIRPLLAEGGQIVTLQNGVGPQEQLVAAFGPDRVHAGVVTLGATMVRPGVVRHAGEGKIHLAQPETPPPPFIAFVQALRAAGFDLHLAEDVRGLIWGKLAVNAGINPLTALLGVRNGYLSQHTDTDAVMAAAAREVAAVAAAQGIVLPFPNAVAQTRAVAEATAENVSSMLGDRRRGVRSEIDAICGATVRAGREHGVATPVNARLWGWMRQVEEGTAVSDWRIEVEGRIIDLARHRHEL